MNPTQKYRELIDVLRAEVDRFRQNTVKPSQHTKNESWEGTKFGLAIRYIGEYKKNPYGQPRDLIKYLSKSSPFELKNKDGRDWLINAIARSFLFASPTQRVLKLVNELVALTGREFAHGKLVFEGMDEKTVGIEGFERKDSDISEPFSLPMIDVLKKSESWILTHYAFSGCLTPAIAEYLYSERPSAYLVGFSVGADQPQWDGKEQVNNYLKDFDYDVRLGTDELTISESKAAFKMASVICRQYYKNLPRQYIGREEFGPLDSDYPVRSLNVSFGIGNPIYTNGSFWEYHATADDELSDKNALIRDPLCWLYDTCNFVGKSSRSA